MLWFDTQHFITPLIYFFVRHFTNYNLTLKNYIVFSVNFSTKNTIIASTANNADATGKACVNSKFGLVAHFFNDFFGVS